MPFYQFSKEQKLNASLDEVWDFISSPANLKQITPSYMGFDISSPNLAEKMYAGMMISYVVRPLFGIKTRWLTEITHVKNKSYFVDEQRFGPYVIWHHQHFIEPTDTGVLMKDIITYQPPFGVLGAIANTLIIQNKLEEIFEFRRVALEKRYGI